MIDIFGPETPTLMRLMSDLSAMTSDDIDAVERAWLDTSLEQRAAALAAIQGAADPEKRVEISHAALVARQHALVVSRLRGRHESAFAAAAWDAAAAVSAAGHRRDSRAYRVLASALATRLPWLTEAGLSGIPEQRASSERKAPHEPASSPRRGGR